MPARPDRSTTDPAMSPRRSFLGSGLGFRFVVAGLCLAFLWLCVIWALA